MEIRVKTNTKIKKEGIEILKDGRYLISVNADRKEGAANDRVRFLISKYFNVNLEDVSIVKGHTSSTKVLRVKE